MIGKVSIYLGKEETSLNRDKTSIFRVEKIQQHINSMYGNFNQSWTSILICVLIYLIKLTCSQSLITFEFSRVCCNNMKTLLLPIYEMIEVNYHAPSIFFTFLLFLTASIYTQTIKHLNIFFFGNTKRCDFFTMFVRFRQNFFF